MQLLYPVPASSVVTQTFAEHVAWAEAHPGVPYNGGIDYAAPTGTPVECAAPGRVIRVRKDEAGYGWHALVEHDGNYQTLYAHLSQIDVSAGQKLAAGDIIGRVGSTGNSTGPHLHFEVRKDGTPVDPAPLLVAMLDGQDQVPEAPEPASFPSLPRVHITSTVGLNIRQAAGVVYPLAGYLPAGSVVEVMRGVRDGDDTWLQIGHQQWVAMRYGGDEFAAWVAE